MATIKQRDWTFGKPKAQVKSTLLDQQKTVEAPTVSQHLPIEGIEVASKAIYDSLHEVIGHKLTEVEARMLMVVTKAYEEQLEKRLAQIEQSFQDKFDGLKSLLGNLQVQINVPNGAIQVQSSVKSVLEMPERETKKSIAYDPETGRPKEIIETSKSILDPT